MAQSFALHRDAIEFPAPGMPRITLVASFVAGALFPRTVYQPNGIVDGIVVSLFAAVVLTVLVGTVLYAVAKVTARRIPDAITVSASGLAIDGIDRDYAKLTRIRLWRSHAHVRLTLTSLTGLDDDFIIGTEFDKRGVDPVFPELPAFVAALVDATASYPDLLTISLLEPS